MDVCGSLAVPTVALRRPPIIMVIVVVSFVGCFDCGWRVHRQLNWGLMSCPIKIVVLMLRAEFGREEASRGTTAPRFFFFSCLGTVCHTSFPHSACIRNQCLNLLAAPDNDIFACRQEMKATLDRLTQLGHDSRSIMETDQIAHYIAKTYVTTLFNVLVRTTSIEFEKSFDHEETTIIKITKWYQNANFSSQVKVLEESKCVSTLNE